MTPEERKLRLLLWLRHGCPLSALYGDDGEMQCNAVGCHIDFLRQSPDEIERAFVKRGVDLLANDIAYRAAHGFVGPDFNPLGQSPFTSWELPPISPEELAALQELQPGRVVPLDEEAFCGLVHEPLHPEKGEPRNLAEIRSLVRSVEGRQN